MQICNYGNRKYTMKDKKVATLKGGHRNIINFHLLPRWILRNIRVTLNFP